MLHFLINWVAVGGYKEGSVKVVLRQFEITPFQEIHNLQSKKTDVGELEKEREDAMQRLQVR